MTAALVASPAVAEVLAERLAQAERHGHTPDNDADLPLDFLPGRARDYLDIARDCIRGTLCDRDLPRARRKLVQSAALILAALDRLPA